MPHGVRRRALGLGRVRGGTRSSPARRSPGTAGSRRPRRTRRTRSSIREATGSSSGFTAVVFFGVEGALIVFIVKYRRGKRPRNQDGLQIHGSTRLEIIWTVVPVLILAAIGAFVFVKLPVDRERPGRERRGPDDDQGRGAPVLLDVPLPERRRLGRADGRAGRRRRARGRRRARNDVLHSWWVPAARRQDRRDPRPDNQTWFKAPAGTYAAPLRRPLRHPAHADARDGAGRAARRVRELHRGPRREPGGSSSARRSGSTCARSATSSTSRYVGPALGRNPLSTTRKDLETILRKGVGKMPAVGSDWSDDADRRARQVHEAAREGQGSGG